MDTFLFFLFVAVLLGWFLVEQDTNFTIPPDFDIAAGPHVSSPPPSASPPGSRSPRSAQIPDPSSPPIPRRLRRQLARSTIPASSAPPLPPTFLSPVASAFAVSTPVVLAKDKFDTFVDVSWEERFGTMRRVLDPIKGWEWKALAPERLEEIRALEKRGLGPLCDPRRRAGADPVVVPAGRGPSPKVVTFAPVPPAPVPAPVPRVSRPPPVVAAAPPPPPSRSVLEMLAGIPSLSYVPAAPVHQPLYSGGMPLAASSTWNTLAPGSLGQWAPAGVPVTYAPSTAPPPRFAAPPPPPPPPQPSAGFSTPLPPPPPPPSFSAPAFVAPPPLAVAPPAAGQPLVFAPRAPSNPAPIFSSVAVPPAPTPPTRGPAGPAPLYDASGVRATLTTTSSRAPARPSTGVRAGRRPVPRPAPAPRPSTVTLSTRSARTAAQVDAESLAQTPALLSPPLTTLAALFAWENSEDLSIIRYAPGWPLSSFSEHLAVRKDDLRDLINVLRWQFASGTAQPAGGSVAVDCLLEVLQRANAVVEGFIAYKGVAHWDAFQEGGVRSWARALRYAKTHLVDVHGAAMVQQLPQDKLGRLSEVFSKGEQYFGGKFA